MSDISSLIDIPTFERGGHNTMIQYLYRDGSNYKASEEVILEGVLILSQAQEIVDHLDTDMGMEHFIPSAVGLEDLQSRMIGGYSADDHPYHELLSIHLTDQPQTSSVSAEAFYTSFITVNWNNAARVLTVDNLSQ